MKTSPYGTWLSLITATMLTAGAVGISEVIPDGDTVWWAERSPDGRLHVIPS